jgi:hypothetical protein
LPSHSAYYAFSATGRVRFVFTGSLSAKRCCYERCSKPSPLMGEGFGGGDPAELVGDRLMDAIEIC